MTAIALASLLVVLYTYAGYPSLMMLWSKLAPRGVSGRDDYEPTVSVCFSACNGAHHLADKIRSLQELDYPRGKLEFLVFSDGSTDDTELIARELSATDPRIRLLSSIERFGKPTALNRLCRAATGEILLLCDVRQPLAERSLRALLRPLADPSVGCVSGSLVLRGNTGAGMYWRYERAIRTAESRVGSVVGVSGSIYATRRAEMPELPSDILLDDVFVPMKLALSGRRRIVLAGDAEAYDDACDDQHEFARKVRTLAGNYQLFAKMPGLLVPGWNPIWFQMMSHKLLRLLCPWALIALVLSSAALAFSSNTAVIETEFWRALLSAQVAFYIFAALGTRAGRVGALGRTFLVLNAAAVVGLWRFLRGSQTVLW